MIHDLDELKTAVQGIARYHVQLAHLRRTQSDPETYRALAGAVLLEMQRLQVGVREWLTAHPPQASPERPRLLNLIHD